MFFDEPRLEICGAGQVNAPLTFGAGHRRGARCSDCTTPAVTLGRSGCPGAS